MLHWQTIDHSYTTILMDLDELGIRHGEAADAMAVGQGGFSVVAAHKSTSFL